MQVAAIYDIHGNLPALEAVLDDISRLRVDLIVVGGDVLPGPMPKETINCLQHIESPVQFIMGNGDRETIAWKNGQKSNVIPKAYQESMRWVAEQLDPEVETWIAGWPKTISLSIPPLGEVLFCHATPRNDTEIFTRRTSEERLLPIFDSVKEATIVCGHTHMQFDRMIGEKRIVNAGSVGMPFGEPGAYWLLLGPDTAFRSTSYDLEKAAERIRNTKYPQAEEFALHNILHPPTEKEIVESFSRAELK